MCCRKVMQMFIVIVMVMMSSVALSKNVAQEPDSTINRLEICKDAQLGVRFYCSPQWKLRVVDNAVLIIISSNPSVTLTIAKIDPNTKFLGQLTDSVLKEKELYADGFRTERVDFAGRNALQVKAFSRQHTERRLLDFFFIHDRALHGLLFSVEPKENWDDYKHLVKQVAENFEFLEK